MNIKGNLKYILTGSILFLVIYIVIAAVPMGTEIYFEPVWSRTVEARPLSPATKGTDEPIPVSPAIPMPSGLEAFRLGTTFGYFSPDGSFVSATDSGTLHTSISRNAWAVYPSDATSTEIHNPDGSLLSSIKASGFIHLDEDRTYMFLPGGDAVSQYSAEGTVMWKKEHTAPISAFNSSPAATIIGYADGKLVCTAPDGSEQFSFYPGGSNQEVILGAAISTDGTLAACVSGIDRQRILLIKISGGQYKIVYHAWLESNLRRQAFVDFETTGRFAFFETADSIGIIDCRKNSVSFLKIPGQIISAGECPGDSVFVVLSKNGSEYTLSAVENPNRLVAQTHFTAQNAFMIQRENAIFLGTDNRVSRINIRGIK